MKEAVDGIIMVVSCQKHMNTRLKEFKLPRDQYDNWKVVYVIGDLFLDKAYEMRGGNYLWVKCEDSYIHIIKKVALAIEYLYELYDIKQGVLRCGDDLTFNEENLLAFIRGPKASYFGKNFEAPNNYTYVESVNETRIDYFMVDYYKKHPEDFDNPQHNLKGVEMMDYIKRPNVCAASGVIYFVSNATCKVIVDHMKAISYNVFHLDEKTQSYPYTIEDCGITFIMFSNNIPFTNSHRFYSDYQYNPYVICTHTNKYK